MAKSIKRTGMMSLYPFNVVPKPNTKKKNTWWRKYKNQG